jgi:hypothetical protein
MGMVFLETVSTKKAMDKCNNLGQNIRGLAI